MLLAFSLNVWLGAQQPPKPPTSETPKPETDTRRTELNLLGKTDTASGESRRNENIYFNSRIVNDRTPSNFRQEAGDALVPF